MADDAEELVPERYKGTKRWMAETVIRPRSLHNLEPNTISKLLDTLSSAHHLDGVSAGEPEPTLMFHLPDHVPPVTLSPDRLGLFVWGWPGRFGACMTVTAYIRPQGFVSRISLDQETEAFHQLKTGRCVIVFGKDHRAVSAFDVDFGATEFANEKFNTHWDAVFGHKTVILRDVDATYWDVVEHNDTLAPHLTLHDQLSCGWIRAFRAVADYAQEALIDLSDSAIARDFRTVSLPDSVMQFLEVAVGSNKSVTKVYQYFSECLQQNGWLVKFLKELKALYIFDQWSPTYYTPSLIFASYLHTSKLTKSGLALPWIDGTEGGQLRQLDLDPRGFPSESAIKDYWARLPSAFFIDWGLLITGRDVHIAPPDLAKGWASVKLESALRETEASIEALLEEAVANKKWTIPPHAIVELNFGPFAFCEIVELDHEVYFVLRDAQWQFCIASVNAQNHSWLIQLWPDEEGPRQKEVNTASKLLLAAIIRDFWVVEERERVFVSSSLPNRIAKNVRSDEEPRVVYLPRVRYKSVPDVKRCSEALAHQERRRHFVAAHLRRAEVPSKYQLLLAEIYGLSVPMGYTFVRPHERGHRKMEVLYRSRSALQSLYTTVEDRASAVRPQWFQFERDVSKLMERLGYEVQHVAASLRGDHGVDVYATKLIDEQLENWIIQCKCYSPRHKVGPKVVRELIGSLSRYETATKGMIVTTSSFTAGAIQEGQRVGIRLMEGAEFTRLLR